MVVERMRGTHSPTSRNTHDDRRGLERSVSPRFEPWELSKGPRLVARPQLNPPVRDPTCSQASSENTVSKSDPWFLAARESDLGFWLQKTSMN